MEQFNTILQKNQYIHHFLLLLLLSSSSTTTISSSSSSSSLNSASQSYHPLTNQQELIMNILLQSIEYFIIYLTFRFISIYVQQRSKRLACYTYTAYFFLNQRKQLKRHENHGKLVSLFHQLPSDDDKFCKAKPSTELKNSSSYPIILHKNIIIPTELHNRQYQEIIPKPLAMTTDQTGKNGTIHLPSSKGRSINKNDLSLSDPFAKDDSSKNEVLTKLDSCKNTKKYFNDIDSNNHNYNDESIRWPPQRDVDIYDVVQRTLSNNLVKLWKQHEVLMEKYMENFPGQPSKRRRHSGFHRNRNDQASPTQTNNYHPTPSRQQHQSTFPMNAGDYLSTTLNNNNTNRHNRHKLYLLAREVLLYYEKEYGSHRGTPEAERIIFLRQAISDFTTSGS